MRLTEVPISSLPLERFHDIIGEDAMRDVRGFAEHAERLLSGRTVWNVNSTATGGGVAEMVPPLLSYSRGSGVEARWVTIQGDAAFFAITKRLHNVLHGLPTGAGTVGEADREHYERTLRSNGEGLAALVREGDIVLLHDPQTAGLSEAMRAVGAITLWRCHIGTEVVNDLTRSGWEFLLPYIREAHRCIFSRQAYVPEELTDRAVIIPPSIDPFSPKNDEMEPAVVRSILRHLGIIRNGADHPMTFTRRDGTTGVVEHVPDIVRAGAPPNVDDRLVVQVSRWDRLKDMQGVMEGFALHADLDPDVHLALVGPNVHGVTDDPEGAEVLEECIDVWRNLPQEMRRRIQLVCLPLEDTDENAAMVNAIQRHAAVVVQKSLAEGFGLTVSEAMWKARPVLASAVGGISDQIVDGEHGVLLENPADVVAFGAALSKLLADPGRAAELGAAAKRRVAEQFLNVHHLARYHRLFADLLRH